MNIEKELDRLAQDYLSEGYQVILHPQGEQLPGFAVDFGADLLATRGNEHVLVQVKQDRADLEADPEITRQAETINSQPGWRYDLVVLNQANPLRRVARMAGEPTVEQIEQMLREAEVATRAGSLRAGFLVAWAGLEAAMRRNAQRAGVGGAAGTLPPTLIRELYSTGRILTDDFHQLEEARRIRNEIVHGFAPPAIEEANIRSLLEISRRLLSESENMETVVT
jgi:hypothetical protein